MNRERTLWTWHLLAGAVIAVLLGLHMGIMHLDALLGWANPHEGHPIEWANVLERAKSAGFMVTYVLLLGAALFHGLYGVRNIVLELGPSAGARHAITAIVVIGGLGLFAYGSWAAVAAFQNAQAV